MEFVQSPDELQIMEQGLTETDADIQDKVGGGNPMSKGKVPLLGQKGFDFGHQVIIMGGDLHIPGLPLHMHQHDGYSRLGGQMNHAGVKAQGADVIYQIGSCIQSGLSDISLIRVDGYGYVTVLSDSLD